MLLAALLFTLCAFSNLPLLTAASCTTDSCLRALRSKSATASSSCSAFLKTTTISTPTYASTCSAKSKYSSACSCLLGASTSSTTTTTTKSSSSSKTTTSSTSKTASKTTCTSGTSAYSVPPPTPDVCSTNGSPTNTPYPGLSSTSIASNFIDTCAELCLNYPGCKSFLGNYGNEGDTGVCQLLSLPISQLQLNFAGTGYGPNIYDVVCFAYAC